MEKQQSILPAFEAGQKRTMPVVEGLPMTMTVIDGASPGKCVLLSAGVHGCEYCSIQAALELARELEPATMRGRAVLVPVANESGFRERLAALVAEDGQNLNRMFPGNPDGSRSERLAWALTTLQDQADFYVDMHGGDLHESMHPFVFVPGVARPEVTGQARAAARCLDVDVRVLSGATTGAYNSAALRGIPSLLIERGGNGIWSRGEVDAYKRDILSLLRFVGILEGQPDDHGARQRETSPTYLESGELAGFWYPEADIRPGLPVVEGQPLGEIRDLGGNILRSYLAVRSGVVLYMTVSLAVKEGTPLVAYG